MVACTVVACVLPVLAQDRIFRCGNEYTNDANVAKAKGCKPLEGGNITIIQGTNPQATTNRASRSSAPRSPTRSDSAEQRARDSDAQQILEAELRKAEDRLEQAKKAYANGQPEKVGIESRNHQRYLDRVAELKAGVDRAEADVAGLKRELQRMGASSTSPTPASPSPAATSPSVQ
ncbi:MAG: hypothetical protein KDF54_04115 [Hydrogenophaga sp.]|nr:hypothetical protein [Hydrogenophaga sp.]